MTGSFELKKHNDYDSNKNENKNNVIANANVNVDDSDIVTVLNDGVNVSMDKHVHRWSNREQLDGMPELNYHDHDPNHNHDHDTLHIHAHLVLNHE